MTSVERPTSALVKAGARCPEDRISSPTSTRDGVEILDISNYTPFFISSINNALSRGASSVYRERFGIGISEWRAVSMLAIEPDITAGRICDVVNLDKAAASRALATLDEQGYLTSEVSETDPRKKRWCLSRKGYDLHEEIMRIALAREETLIEGADPQDLEATIRVMRIMLKNLQNL